MTTVRKTKFMVTYGPSCKEFRILRRLIELGADVFRFNGAHVKKANYGEIEKAIEFIRKTAAELGRVVAIFFDLGGVKFRLGSIGLDGKGKIELVEGQEVWIRAIEFSDDPSVLPFPDAEVLGALVPGNFVYIADGTVRLEVQTNDERGAWARVQIGGEVSSHKGVNLPGVTINRPVLTNDDMDMVAFGERLRVEWFGISYVYDGPSTKVASDYIRKTRAKVMAKLERPEACGGSNLDDILEEVDAVMVARGDLGVEGPREDVPDAQEDILKRSRKKTKLGMVGTQVLLSLKDEEQPSRGEVSGMVHDIRIDLAGSLLFSDEIAIGDHPELVVQEADVIARKAESRIAYYLEDLPANNKTETTAKSACMQARDYPNAVIIAITSTGRTAIAVAKFLPEARILAYAHDPYTLAQLAMVGGVEPVGVLPVADFNNLVASAIRESINNGSLNPDVVEHVILVLGYVPGVTDSTNATLHLDREDYLRLVATYQSQEEAICVS
ncbi:MAG TPA: pyruvate kinase [Candidatus Paceibacterota bacterium]|nr:pyruvate kinase [Candidatus Paceibacterota bacterium]